MAYLKAFLRRKIIFATQITILAFLGTLTDEIYVYLVDLKKTIFFLVKDILMVDKHKSKKQNKTKQNKTSAFGFLKN